MNVYTVSFFGHRNIDCFFDTEDKIDTIVRKLIREYEYVEFLVGRDGDFDQIAASVIRKAKMAVNDANNSLTWVMPYDKAEYKNNVQSFENYYDNIEVCEASSQSHPKAAILIRNKEMIDRSDLIVCYVDYTSGGAYQAIHYAEQKKKRIINLAVRDAIWDDFGIE